MTYERESFFDSHVGDIVAIYTPNWDGPFYSIGAINSISENSVQVGDLEFHKADGREINTGRWPNKWLYHATEQNLRGLVAIDRLRSCRLRWASILVLARKPLRPDASQKTLGHIQKLMESVT